MTSRPAGILLVGHGTQDNTGTDQFFKLADRLGELTSMPIAASLLEFQQPTIAQGWQSLLSHGVEHVHVAPLLLFAAGHAKQDIPAAVAAAATASPAVTWDQCRPLSRADDLVALVLLRLRQTITRSPVAAGRRVAVVMTGRGSFDPCAQADMRVLTEIVATRFRKPTDDDIDPPKDRAIVSDFYTAFYAMAHPRLPDVLQSIAGTGRYDRIIVHPHLLFSGKLYDAIVAQTDAAANRYRDISFLVSDYLGPDPGVARSILRRIETLRHPPNRSVVSPGV